MQGCRVLYSRWCVRPVGTTPRGYVTCDQYSFLTNVWSRHIAVALTSSSVTAMFPGSHTCLWPCCIGAVLRIKCFHLSEPHRCFPEFCYWFLTIYRANFSAVALSQCLLFHGKLQVSVCYAVIISGRIWTLMWPQAIWSQCINTFMPF